MTTPWCVNMAMNDLSTTGNIAQSARTASNNADHAFVLHTYPYRETSLIVEAFTAVHGRVVLVAKGAKRPHGALRGRLQPFQALTLAWFGKAEMKTLKTAEQDRILPQLSGRALLSAFYMNELLLKLTLREDPHEDLFAAYARTVTALAAQAFSSQGARDIATLLRKFEVALLKGLGYALQLEVEADSHVAIDPTREYLYLIERGPVDTRHAAREKLHDDALQLSGKTLIDMARDDYIDPQTQTQSKQLMRKLINHLLGDKTLHTRTLIRELK